jgi:hypothetical protein
MHSEVTAHRGFDRGAVGDEHPGHRAEQRLALLEGRKRIGQKRRALAGDDLLKLGNGVGVLARRRRAALDDGHFLSSARVPVQPTRVARPVPAGGRAELLGLARTWVPNLRIAHVWDLASGQRGAHASFRAGAQPMGGDGLEPPTSCL